MTAIFEPTIVTYPAGEVSGTGIVRYTDRAADGRLLLVTDRTPFHPLDHTWPDQPADRGSVTVGGIEVEVQDVLTGAVHKDSATVHLGSDIPGKRNDPDWIFLVVHVLPENVSPVIGDSVMFNVDHDYRHTLSRGHSACHLASLALNESLAGLWTKTPRTDCRGNPDFDQSAIALSRIIPNGAVDEYRLGKSLRKSGFTTNALPEAVKDVEDTVNHRLESWIASAGRSWIECESAEVTARRWWNCELPQGLARIACGGTHVTSTKDLEHISVELDLELDAGTMTMRTSVKPGNG